MRFARHGSERIPQPGRRRGPLALADPAAFDGADAGGRSYRSQLPGECTDPYRGRLAGQLAGLLRHRLAGGRVTAGQQSGRSLHPLANVREQRVADGAATFERVGHLIEGGSRAVEHGA